MKIFRFDLLKNEIEYFSNVAYFVYYRSKLHTM